jgi:hypothetical protein
MELVDRYLSAVRTFLPRAEQEDIIRELSTNLSSQIEDRQTELGRRLSEAEIEALLRRHGHPMLVAGRYRTDRRSLALGRQLIGPALFPFYAWLLKLNVGLTVAVCVVVTLALGKSLSGAVPAIFFHMLLQAGILTLVFAAAETYLTRFPDRWDPRRPPRAPARGLV